MLIQSLIGRARGSPFAFQMDHRGRNEHLGADH